MHSCNRNSLESHGARGFNPAAIDFPLGDARDACGSTRRKASTTGGSDWSV
ncbi:hypothetical protein EniLVp02_0072 [Vibrio phage EniLVp02]